MATAGATSISKRRKFVADGVFYAELNEFFQRELAEEGYSGVEVRVTPTVTDISMLLPLDAFFCLLIDLQSSAQHTPKKSWASKDAAFASSHHSFRNASNSRKIQCPSMLRRSKIVVSLRSPSASLCVTNYSMDWL